MHVLQLQAFLDQGIIGLRAGGQLSFSSKQQGFATLGYELRDYDAKDPAFLTKCKDDQYDTTIGLRFAPARDWSIKPQFSYTKNDSNIQINDYERKVISINVREDFNWQLLQYLFNFLTFKQSKSKISEQLISSHSPTGATRRAATSKDIG